MDTISEIEGSNIDSSQGIDVGADADINTYIDTDKPNILVLGDSIGYGFGDDPDQGIGKRYAAMLDPKGIQDITVTNLSISGSKVSELFELVKRSENAAILNEATLIILSIGGNDLNNIDDVDVLSLEINR